MLPPMFVEVRFVFKIFLRSFTFLILFAVPWRDIFHISMKYLTNKMVSLYLGRADLMSVKTSVPVHHPDSSPLEKVVSGGSCLLGPRCR